MADSPFSTPKRKREEMIADSASMLNTASQFTFDPSSAPEDGNASPRTRVAHRFRGLALGGGGGGGGGPSLDLSTPDHDAQDGSRKRLKLPDVEMPDAVSAVATDPSTLAQQVDSPSRRRQSVRLALDDAVVEQSETIANTGDRSSSSSSPDDADADVDASTSTSTPTLDSPSPPAPIHKLPTPPSSQPPSHKTTTTGAHPPRRRRRANTPPFPQTAPTHATTKPTKSRTRIKSKTPSSQTGTDPSTTTTTTTTGTITDPLRASLTWRDDEITVYDPDDSDDDGTGINGIGFKPTPAVAQARSFRRRQQLAEYRKREEREARARRSAARRRGGGNGGVNGSGNSNGNGSGNSNGSGSGSMGRGVESGMSAGGGAGGVKKGRRRVRFLEGER